MGASLRRRPALGPTAHEISRPCAASPTKICDRDIALDARDVSIDLGSCLLIEFGAAAIVSSPPSQGHGRLRRDVCQAALLSSNH
jgi:hypothetical protein